MDEKFYLGLDGGGTSSRARLYDVRGRILGEGLSGSSNLTRGIDVAAAAIRSACKTAIAISPVPGLPFSQIHAGLGLAGANVPSLAAALEAVPFGFASLKLASDAVIACLGAHGGADGAILILGTGSQGLALVKGQITTVGGWGFLVSDDGSGAALGRAAARAAVAAHEHWQPASALTREIMRQFKNDPSEMVAWAARATPRDYGEFAPLVLQHFSVRDEVAIELISQSLHAVEAMIGRLLAVGATKIALMGGLAEPYAPLLSISLRAHLSRPQGDAMSGALYLAREGVLT